MPLLPKVTLFVDSYCTVIHLLSSTRTLHRYQIVVKNDLRENFSVDCSLYRQLSERKEEKPKSDNF